MQISPSAALLNVLSSLPAQAGATGVTQPAKPPTPAQPPALVAAAKALAGRGVAAQSAAPVPTLPPVDGNAPRNLPRGSVVNLLI
jgi:hypothetical protein